MANNNEAEIAYKADTLINSVSKIQEMKHEAAKEYLESISKTITDDDQFYCICRMLFKKAGPGSDFRAPFLGDPAFLGGTAQSDWPLSPVEIVSGIPFLIVKGYSRKGRPESQSAYLEYCLENCAWNDFYF